MGIFFLLFLVGYTARSFFVDRSQGMIERIRAAPVRPLEILAGKALSVFVFGSISLLTVAAITTVAFGADWGGAAPAVAVCVAMVTAVVCATALVIGVARTQRQAEGISTAIVFGLAVLGGNFVFLSTAPPVMRQLSLLTPTAGRCAPSPSFRRPAAGSTPRWSPCWRSWHGAGSRERLRPSSADGR
jgi:ABC-2 type transport system permease protein